MNDQNYQMYRIQPGDKWRFVEFANEPVTISDNEYSFNSFVNSGDFIIHEVVAIKQKYSVLYHVWYEEK